MINRLYQIYNSGWLYCMTLRDQWKKIMLPWFILTLHVSGVERSVCHVFDNTRILIENNIKKLIYWFWVNVNKAKTSKKKKSDYYCCDRDNESLTVKFPQSANLLILSTSKTVYIHHSFCYPILNQINQHLWTSQFCIIASADAVKTNNGEI